ncbi:MAG: tRNA (adenosine(37)-N6)-threonylcarbamoyltransferase complex dimerization subunit type 1 TsaB [Candidatus Omnitrophota bacterium]
MKILAFDTSTKFLTIACLENRAVKAEFHKNVGIRHNELLIPAIEKMLKKIKWNIKEIELICVGLGPGSFTGLRIAVATVKAIAMVVSCKIAGVVTMDAIVKNFPKTKGYIAPFLDARKQKIYTAIYDYSQGTPKRVTDYLLTDAREFLEKIGFEILFVGDAVEPYKEILSQYTLAKYNKNTDWYPRAVEIARVGYEKALSGQTDDPETLEPLYLHAKECNIRI